MSIFGELLTLDQRFCDDGGSNKLKSTETFPVVIPVPFTYADHLDIHQLVDFAVVETFWLND